MLFKTLITRNINKVSFYKAFSFKFSDLATENYYIPLNPGNISDNYGARVLKNRLGRGPGSGKGKTAGRGHKGYTGRTGEPARHLIGGATPYSRRIPKFGFNRKGLLEKISYINLTRIYYLIKKNRIDPSKTITIKDLFKAGGITKVGDGVKLLGGGKNFINQFGPLNIEVSYATKEAIDAVKSAGGSVSVVYRTPLYLKSILKPYKFKQDLKLPNPPYKKVKKLLIEEKKGAMLILFK